eukprot:gene15524-15671_t
MITTSVSANYSPVARLFHWLTAALVLAAFILSEGGPESRVFSPANSSGLTLHETLGFAVFCLTLARLFWRIFDTAPQPVPMPKWMHLASSLAHFGLFGLLIAVPATAMLGSWLEGHALQFYVFGAINPPMALSAALGKTILSLHTLLGDVIIWLAGAHAAAAIYHHVILKDNVLRAMLFSSKAA